MALTYINFIAMVVGYTTIGLVFLVIILFAYLILKDKYEHLKCKKVQKKRQKEQEEKKKEQTNASELTRSQLSEVKEPTQANVQIPINTKNGDKSS